MATNAVRHSASGRRGGGVWVTVLVSRDRLRVEIQDDGGSVGRPRIPVQGAGWDECGRVLRGGWAKVARRDGGYRVPGAEGPDRHWPDGLLPELYPQTVFLFGGLGPGGAREASEVFPQEAGAWRTPVELEAARARVWLGHGRVWDAGVCAGRAQAYRAAAEQVEEVLVESLQLWEEYKRQAGEDGR